MNGKLLKENCPAIPDCFKSHNFNLSSGEKILEIGKMNEDIVGKRLLLELTV